MAAQRILISSAPFLPPLVPSPPPPPPHRRRLPRLKPCFRASLQGHHHSEVPLKTSKLTSTTPTPCNLPPSHILYICVCCFCPHSVGDPCGGGCFYLWSEFCDFVIGWHGLHVLVLWITGQMLFGEPTVVPVFRWGCLVARWPPSFSSWCSGWTALALIACFVI